MAAKSAWVRNKIIIQTTGSYYFQSSSNTICCQSMLLLSAVTFSLVSIVITLCYCCQCWHSVLFLLLSHCVIVVSIGIQSCFCCCHIVLLLSVLTFILVSVLSYRVIVVSIDTQCCFCCCHTMLLLLALTFSLFSVVAQQPCIWIRRVTWRVRVSQSLHISSAFVANATFLCFSFALALTSHWSMLLLTFYCLIYHQVSLQ